ncbi:sensor histidine kinase [Microbacterium sp. RD1]|uniref:sensor histidine kinase n=1 Tax=Microbacterium sp. RD1 TaxID=3457313 RepID=UPI003FA5E0AF
MLRPSQIVVDAVVAVLFALIAVPVEASLLSLSSAGQLFAAVAVALILALALALRRLAPGLALGIAWVSALVQMLALLNPSPSNLAIFAVLYASAAYGGRIVYWLGFASAFLGALVITLYLYVFTGGTLTLSLLSVGLAVLVAATFALLLAWVSGALVRTAIRAREARRAREAAEADAVAEQERVRIARDMHDVVAHSLAVVIAQADGARYAAASDPAAATAALDTISSTARAALGDVRLLLTQLRHSEAAGPQPTLADVEALYAQVRAAGVDLSVDVDPAPVAEPSASVQLAVYRILQEALTNALRHGTSGPVSVRLAWHPAFVDLAVRNPLNGSAAAAGGGHGIIGMRERAQLVGGTLEAGPDRGTFTVTARLPIGEAA